MSTSKEKYEGDYKVISDQGRMKFDLSTKWVAGIIVAIVIAASSILIGVIKSENSELREEIATLKEENKKMEEELVNDIDNLEGNQRVLLDRSEMQQMFFEQWMRQHGGLPSSSSSLELPSGTPGSNTPGE